MRESCPNDRSDCSFLCTTWNFGFSLGIDIRNLRTSSVKAAFSYNYSETTTVGNLDGTNAPCDGEGAEGNYTCALKIKPTRYRIAGYCSDNGTEMRVPYVVTMPLTPENGIASSKIDLWSCGECPDADSPTAPELCDLECRDEC